MTNCAVTILPDRRPADDGDDPFGRFAAALAAGGCAPVVVSAATIERAPDAGFILWCPPVLPEQALPDMPLSLRTRILLMDSRMDAIRALVPAHDLAGGLDRLAFSRWASDSGVSTYGLFGRATAGAAAGLRRMGQSPGEGPAERYATFTAAAPETLPGMVCRYLRVLLAERLA